MDFNFDTSTISTILVLDPGTSNLTVAGPAGLIVPAGSSAQRVQTDAVIRFNTDYPSGGSHGVFEGFDGIKWGNVVLAGSTGNLSSLDALNSTGFIVQTGTGAFAERTITVSAGQLTVSNGNGVAANPLLGLANVGTSGTYVSVTTDQFGRVTSGSGIQNWNTITNIPTTLAGYTISDAVKNAGNAISIQSGSGSLPSAGTNGRFFYATDTASLWFDNGVTWQLESPALTGDVTAAFGNTVTTLSNTTVTPGTYGGSGTVPSFTVDSKGRLTAAANIAIPSSSISVTGGDLTMSGSTGSAINNATLATTGVGAGEYGDSTHVAQITVDTKGRVTAAANVAIPNALSFTTDATGSGTVGSAVALTLATVNATTGFFGSNNQVATFTVNGKGLTTFAGNVSITPASIGAVNTNVVGQPSGVATLDNLGKLTNSQIPSSLVGALQYNGTWDATTGNTSSVSYPTINYATPPAPQGEYFIVNVAGSTTVATTVGNVNQWNVGDMVVSNGALWSKIDGLSSEVTSVFGRVGAVTATLASADFANQGTTTTVLHGNVAGNPSWGAINLSSDVTGTLPASMVPALTGDVTSAASGSNVVVTFNTVNSNTGMFGDATHVSQVTVNAKGLVTAAANVAIPTSLSFTTDATGSGTVGSAVALTLATVNAAPGPFGSATSVPTFVVNAKGLVTSAANVTIPNSLTFSGNVTGSGTVGSTVALTLENVGTPGTYGSATAVPVITTDSKGRVTSVSTSSISSAITVTGPDFTLSGTTGTAITNGNLAVVNGNVGQFGGAGNVIPVITVNNKGLVTAVGTSTVTPLSIGAVQNIGSTAPSIQEGVFGSMPAAGTAGRIYIATDTKAIYRDNGVSWDEIGSETILYAENPSTPAAQTVTGTNALALGSGNKAAGTYSLATGFGANALVYGGEVRANGSFATAGDAQTGKYVLRNVTTVSATPVELFADGSGASARITLVNNSAVAYSALIVAHNYTTAGNDGAWKIEGLIRRGANAGATALVGNRSKTILTRPNANWDVEVYAANGALTFQSQANTNDTVRWVCTVATSEVTS